MKAVFKGGVIYPNEPVPADWSEGTELEVEKITSDGRGDTEDALDRWFAELESSCSQLDADDDRILKSALSEARRQEKELAW
jgi:hypothetical protein